MFNRERIVEILQSLVSNHDELEPALRNYADGLRESRNLNDFNKRVDDEHRKSAFARFDTLLEQRLLTPEEADRARNDWDIRHGY